MTDTQNDTELDTLMPRCKVKDTDDFPELEHEDDSARCWNCRVWEAIDSREQAAELRGKTTVLKKLAGKVTPRYEDTHPEYTKGFEEMKSKVKFELQRLQATKPEKEG